MLFMNKRINQLAIGDTVTNLTNEDGTVVTFQTPMTVTSATILKGVTCMVKLTADHLPAGRLAFWPSGKTDKRTVTLR